MNVTVAGPDVSALETEGCWRTTRFLDLLDIVEGSSDEEDDDFLSDNDEPKASPSKQSLLAPVSRQESSHGPLHWNTRCSIDLQRVVDMFDMEELHQIDFSVTVADPSQPDCPLVACSVGFTELTGYKVQEIVGRNCRFLIDRVPPNLIDEETRLKCRQFCVSVSQGIEYEGAAEVLVSGMPKPWVALPQVPRGELICVQTNARKTGELFRNMFYLKQVELDDANYILGLQAALPEELEDENYMSKLEQICRRAFGRLEANMSTFEQVLSSQFWYSAPMRRQI